MSNATTRFLVVGILLALDVALAIVAAAHRYAPLGLFLLAILLIMATAPRRLAPATVLAALAYVGFAGYVGVPLLVLLINAASIAAVGFVAMQYVLRRRGEAAASAQAEQQRQLHLSGERMRVALANSPIIVVNQDRDLRYTWVYRGGGESNPAELQGRTDADFLRSQEAARITALKRQVLVSGVGMREEVRATHSEIPSYYDLTCEPLRDDEGQVVGITCAATDITGRKQLEAERAALLMRETAARQRLQQFLAVVAHELAQPLTGIRGNAQLLRRRLGGQPETMMAPAAAIEEAASRMQRLVADLRDAATVGSGQLAIQPREIDLMAVVRQIVAEQQASNGTHRLEVQGPEQVVGRWDADRIGQVVMNLVGNAVKYSPEGSRVQILVETTPVEVRLRVVDQGPGIAPEEQATLFEPFSRLRRDTGAPGSGLGLYIAKGIVEAHGGRIWVESVPGEGAVFGVALPRGA